MPSGIGGVTSISEPLLFHLRFTLRYGIQEQARRDRLRYGVNGFTEHALAAYPLAIAAWEAFLYQTLLSPRARAAYSDAPLWRTPEEEIDGWSVQTKTQLVPSGLIGKSFDESCMPFQDFKLLISVRNAITHFKMRPEEPSPVKNLAQHGVLLRPDKWGLAWTHRLCCTEGIRWAITTLAKMSKGLWDMFEDERARSEGLLHLIQAVELSDVRSWYAEIGIDPSSDLSAEDLLAGRR